jgi:hypothetical protein
MSKKIASVLSRQGGPDGDDDEPMEDAEGIGNGAEHHRGGSGGAGPGATGGILERKEKGLGRWSRWRESVGYKLYCH